MKKQTKLSALARHLVTSPEILNVAHVVAKGLKWIMESPVKHALSPGLGAYYVTGGIQTLACVALSLLRTHVSSLLPTTYGDGPLSVIEALRLREFPTEKKLAHLLAVYVENQLK